MAVMTLLGVFLCSCGFGEGMALSESNQIEAASVGESIITPSYEETGPETEPKPDHLAPPKAYEPKELFKQGAGVFSWDHLPTIQDVRCMTDNNITEIYQYIRPEYTDENVCAFLKAMNEVDIQVYLLDGEPEWTYQNEYQGMKKVLDRTRHFNSLVDEKERFKGILFDVEPYVLDKWHKIPDQLLEEYCNNIISIKQECSEDSDKLDICVCVPSSYDKMGHDKWLRNLIKESDQTFVLNYAKGLEIDNLKREAALARWYKKRLVNVYELQPGLLSQTTNSITYYNDGIVAANINYKEIKEAYPDHNIAVAYHTLEYLRVLSLK
jgi:hypothetical protein